MRSLTNLLTVIALASSMLASPAPGAQAPDTPASQDSRADQRYPQAVRVGDLAGRRLLAPEEWQPVLGWVKGAVRDGDGDPSLIVTIGGWLGGWLPFGQRDVAVSADTVALLGEHVALMDMSPDELNKLPTFVPGSQAAVGPNEIVRIGIVKPFH